MSNIVKKFFNRVLKGASNGYDVGDIQQSIYNVFSGGQKSLSVGPWLIGIEYDDSNDGSGPIAYTTDATTARRIERGTALAFYAPAGGELVRLTDEDGDPAIGALGDVGENFSVFALAQGWNYFSTGQWSKVKTAAAVRTYIIADETHIRGDKGKPINE